MFGELLKCCSENSEHPPIAISSMGALTLIETLEILSRDASFGVIVFSSWFICIVQLIG